MFTLFKTRSYNLTLISSLFADGIQFDDIHPSYENVLRVTNAPKALKGESSGRKSRKRKVFY